MAENIRLIWKDIWDKEWQKAHKQRNNFKCYYSDTLIVTIFFHFERTPVRLFHLFESAANSNPKSISRQENIHCNQTRKKKNSSYVHPPWEESFVRRCGDLKDAGAVLIISGRPEASRAWKRKTFFDIFPCIITNYFSGFVFISARKLNNFWNLSKLYFHHQDSRLWFM